jgi:hypothetical protein
MGIILCKWEQGLGLNGNETTVINGKKWEQGLRPIGNEDRGQGLLFIIIYY